MYSGKYTAKRKTFASRSKKTSRKRLPLTVPALLALLLVVFTVGGTMAYLLTDTTPVRNKFTPTHVSCLVNESFNGTTKSAVTVQNTGDIPAYIRVKLISYRVAGDDNHRIGGTARVPDFTPGAGWVANGGYYYYTSPVASNGFPATNLIDSIALEDYTDVDADGGKQVIEVMAEAIQSEPAGAIGEAWGVSITGSGVTAYTPAS